MRLIDADVLKQTVGSYNPVKYTYEYGYVITVEDIDSAPTVDAVEVVRCKDCKHWVTVVDHKKAEYGLCDAMKAPISTTPRDGFCYKGERKETDSES